MPQRERPRSCPPERKRTGTATGNPLAGRPTMDDSRASSRRSRRESYAPGFVVRVCTGMVGEGCVSFKNQRGDPGATGWVGHSKSSLTREKAMRESLPRFSSLRAYYPSKHEVTAKALLDSIGGQVRASLGDGTNTCAIRISWALNESGARVRATAGVHLLKGEPRVEENTTPQTRLAKVSNNYMFRVLDVKTYLSARYGPGKLIYDGRHSERLSVPIPGVTQGIITFEWQGHYGAFGASGHADLFRVNASPGKPGSPPTLLGGCAGECFFLEGPMIAHLWETRP